MYAEISSLFRGYLLVLFPVDYFEACQSYVVMCCTLIFPEVFFFSLSQSFLGRFFLGLLCRIWSKNLSEAMTLSLCNFLRRQQFCVLNPEVFNAHDGLLCFFCGFV